jgi:DNA polymerase III subunit gamma/tau
MAYLVLARRWRPQQFSDIIGQDHVSRTLTNAIEHDRIAHSFIFAGPRGVGKTTTARILAKALNCEKGPTSKPCNKCSNCESITKGNSLDVLEIDGASNRGIDEIRNLRENIHYAPSQGKYKIYIIDEVHMLTKEAFNALLKTLEEPPSHVIFMFATTEIHRVPATILSRCQRFDFKRIPTNTIIKHLQKMCETDNIEIEKDALLEIAKKSDGSMRDAQSILDQIISYSGDKITALQVSEILGLINLDLFFSFSSKIREKNLKELLILCQKVFSDGIDLGEFLVGFEEHFCNLLITKTLENMEFIHVSENFKERYLTESKEFTENDILQYIQLIGEIQNSIKWSTQPQIKFEFGILKLAKMSSMVDIENILEKINLLKKKAPEQSKQTTKPLIPKTENKSIPNRNAKEIQKDWQQFCDKVKTTKISIGNALELGVPKIQDDKLLVKYHKAHSFQMNLLIKNKNIIEKIIEDDYDQIFHVNTEIDETIPEPKLNKTINTQETINQISKTDPLINKLINELGLELT